MVPLVCWALTAIERLRSTVARSMAMKGAAPLPARAAILLPNLRVPAARLSTLSRPRNV
jgi:hypothetical protein